MKNLLQVFVVLVFGFSVIFLLPGCEPAGPATSYEIKLVSIPELNGCKLFRISEPNKHSAVVMRCPQESISVEQQTVTIDGVEYQRIKR